MEQSLCLVWQVSQLISRSGKTQEKGARTSVSLPAIVPQGKIEPTFRTLRDKIEHFPNLCKINGVQRYEPGQGAVSSLDHISSEVILKCLKPRTTDIVCLIDLWISKGRSCFDFAQEATLSTNEG